MSHEAEATRARRASRWMPVAAVVLACCLQGCALIARQATIAYIAVTAQSQGVEIQLFVKGTAPERAVRLLKRGDRLHVFGIPRLDLAEISRRVRESVTKPALLTGALPYEIIIIGVYAKAR